MLFYNKVRLRNAAEKCIAQNNLEKAVQLYGKILRHEPEEKDALCMLGELKIKQGDQTGGLASMRRAAELYAQGGERAKAISIYRNYLQFAPEDVEILQTLADLYQQSTQRDETVQTLLKAGRICAGQDASKAIFYFERAIKIDPDNVETLSALGEICTRERLLAKAGEYNFKAGKRLFEKGDYSRGYQHLYAVIQHDPDNRQVNFMLLETMIRLKSFEDAFIHLNGISKGDAESDLELLNYRADILFELGRTEDLKTQLHKMALLVPEGHSVILRYVDRAMERKNFNLAVGLLDLLDLSQYHNFLRRVQEILNTVLAEDENHAAALQKSVELMNYSGDIMAVKPVYSKLYGIFLKSGEHRRAFQLLEKWLNIDDENDWIRQEMRRLKLVLEEENQKKSDLIRGKLEDIGLPDLIQMLESARKTGVLQIRYADWTGRVFIRTGNIFHVEFKGITGQDGLVQLLKLKGGDFNFDPSLPPETPATIAGPNTQAVLNALRQIDEEEAG